MIKILQIMDNISKASGVSSFVMNIYRNIDKKEVQFDFLVSNKTRISYEEEIKAYGGRIYYINNPLSICTLFLACKNSNIFFENHSSDYTAIQLHSPTIAEMTIRYAKKYGVKNIIIHSHSSMFSSNFLKKLINYILVFRIKKLANHFWYCSKEAAEFLYGEQFQNLSDSQWIKNAIDCNKFTYNQLAAYNFKEKLSMSKAKIALHVSNFSKIKNTSFLVDVIKEVITKDNEWRFIFAGDGPEKAKTEEAIKENGLSDYCFFTGFTDDVKSFMNAADLLLLPSIKEGLPVVTIEAQALGLTCFVTDTITRDADIGGIEYLQLNAQVWTKKILAFKAKNSEGREVLSEKVKNSGFNIINEAKKVEKLFLKMVMEKLK
ncbi:glycosyltransferase [Phascolarctobacterium sp.]|uniref:glycosyltransferase n=1 Tax=Phascolarctobacterium sp. TaxID=2049039 RepID=UPI003F80D503